MVSLLYFNQWCHNDIAKEEVCALSKNDPFTRSDQTRFTMRINSELLEQIKTEAEKNKRSAAKEIEFILEKHMASLKQEQV